MTRFILSSILFIGFIFNSFSQDVVSNSDRGYYIKNGKVVSGIAFEKANRAQRAERLIIPQQKRHEAATFYPGDIEEYGFSGEYRYISADIVLSGTAKKVFLEKILDLDSIGVYSYPMGGGDLFFLQKDDSLPKLIKDEEGFWNLFRNHSCPKITAFIDSKRKKNLDYATLNTYRRAYVDCNTNLFPKFHFGITAEVGSYDRQIGYPTMGYKEGAPVLSDGKPNKPLLFAIGIFVQIPIDECFSFHPEILFIIPDNSGRSIQLPVVFRYNFNYMKSNYIPYIDLGLLLDIKTPPEKELSIWDGSEYRILANSKTSPFRYGAVLGGGIEFKPKSGNSIAAGIRFRFLRGNVNQEYKDIVKSLTLNVAYGF